MECVSVLSTMVLSRGRFVLPVYYDNTSISDHFAMSFLCLKYASVFLETIHSVFVAFEASVVIFIICLWRNNVEHIFCMS